MLALVLGCVTGGCGGAGAEGDGGVTITVTSRAYVEEEVLREIYAQALEAAGFEVRRRKLEQGLLAPEELATGRVSGYPDHLDTTLTEAMPGEAEDVPASATAAYRQAKRQYEEKGFVPLPPASFARTKVVGVRRRTAAEHDLDTLADLKRPSRQMNVLERESYCHGRESCLNGLERRYGIVFESFSAIPFFEPISLVYQALRTGETDAVMLIATEGRLARKPRWLVLLEDEERRLSAANAFWMTTQGTIDEAGPAYEKTILEAQKGLTLEIMRELNARVELDGQPPAKVAAEYLKSTG